MLLVNDVGYEGGVESFSAEHDLPVLQDTIEQDATDSFHADKWYVYLIDQEQNLHRIHYHLNLPSESPRLVDAVNGLLVGEEVP